MAFKTPHPIFQTTDTFQQLVDDLNTYGNVLDSDFQYLDSAIGPGSLRSLRGLDDFATNVNGGRSLVDALNQLDSDLHGAGGGSGADLTTDAKTIVGAINEIEAVFDASDTNITSPSSLEVIVTGNETHTATGNFVVDVDGFVTLDAGTNPILFASAGTSRISHALGATNTITVTGNYTLDVSADITLDADGNDIIFRDGASNRIQHNLGATNTVTVTGGYTLDASGAVVIDTNTGALSFKDAGADAIVYSLDPAGTNTVTVTGALTTTSTGAISFDAVGDITLDADGNDIIFRDGASTRISHALGATNTVTVTGGYTLDASGAIVLDTNTGSLSFKDAGVNAMVYSLDPAGTNTVAVTGNYTLDVSGDIVLDADGGDITIKDGATTAYNISSSGVIARTGDITLDVSGDVILDADGNNIIFKNGAGGDQVDHALADNGTYVVTYPSSVTHTQSAGDLTFNVAGDDVIFTDGSNERVRLNLDAAPNILLTGTSASISNSAGAFTLDVAGDITLDANGGDVLLKDNTVQYGALTNTSGNLIIKSGTTTAMTFSGANVTVAGSITMPATGTGSITSSEISANTVHGAIDEVNERIPNVYNSSGTLLNP